MMQVSSSSRQPLRDAWTRERLLYERSVALVLQLNPPPHLSTTHISTLIFHSVGCISSPSILQPILCLSTSFGYPTTSSLAQLTLIFRGLLIGLKTLTHQCVPRVALLWLLVLSAAASVGCLDQCKGNCLCAWMTSSGLARISVRHRDMTTAFS